MATPSTPAPVRPTLKDKLQQVGKALAGALSGAVVAVLFTTVTDPQAAINPDAVDTGNNAIVALPNTTAEWVTAGVAVLIGFVLPYLKSNFPSVGQALEQYELAQQRVAQGKQQA